MELGITPAEVGDRKFTYGEGCAKCNNLGFKGRTGLYEVLSNQHEVVMVWATDIPAQVRLRQNRDTTHGLCDEGDVDDRIVHWERRSAEYVIGGDMHVMTPLPRTVYGPPDWEDASLDDWLAHAENAP